MVQLRQPATEPAPGKHIPATGLHQLETAGPRRNVPSGNYVDAIRHFLGVVPNALRKTLFR